MIRFAENLNKMITAGLGGALEAPSTEVAVGHRVRYMEASGAVASFETNIAAPIRSLRVDMQPIQTGSGDPSPDNIRPISGRDSVTVKRTGKNLLDVDFSHWRQRGSPYSYINGVVKDGQEAMFVFIDKDTSVDISECSLGFVYEDLSTSVATHFRWVINRGTVPTYKGNLSTSGNLWCTNVFMFPQTEETLNTLKRRFDIMVVYGSTAPSVYEPYDAQSATIQLGTTVYGGTLDISTGKLTVTHGELASYNGEVLTGEWISDRDVYTAGTTPTIGAQVVYVLDTPQTIQLTPAQLNNLVGENNVWSDSGNISLEYPYYEETEGY